MIKFKHKKEQDNFLLYIPSKKHKTWETHKGKVVMIIHHNKPVEKLARWLVKKPTTSDIVLDDMGSSVWKLIDGKNTVNDIGLELKKKYGESCEPVYERLIMYLRYLNKRGWISYDLAKK